ncbi:YlxR family protein [Nocardioides alcanivorans]|uniref:YlxR family protein n=1 Tax=Nocardioides alcanivorans TaxID=2897352 RepID=UPI001F2A4249|nr:YlxR family protein [Nocardioides alcanivorans]
MVRERRPSACPDAGSFTGPVRTCIGCRERAAKSELLRVVNDPDATGLTVVPDLRGSAPGRGAHLHPTVECLELAVRRRAFARALRLAAGPDVDAVRSHITLLVNK